MQAKTIKAILRKKFNEWTETIDDKKVKDLVNKNSIITGGAITSMLLNEEVNDFDVYFTNKQTTHAVASYYVHRFNQRQAKRKGGHQQASVQEINNRISVIISSSGATGEPEGHELEEGENTAVETKETVEEFEPVFLTENAISLKGKIQLITRFYGEADVIHENFDFVHARCYWRSNDYHLELPAESLLAILNKQLVYKGSKYPLASIFRAKKFINRGWTINAGQYLKMALQLNIMDLLHLPTLREQLTGVDFAYFMEVIKEMERHNEGKGNEANIDDAYLVTVIERIFD